MIPNIDSAINSLSAANSLTIIKELDELNKTGTLPDDSFWRNFLNKNGIEDNLVNMALCQLPFYRHHVKRFAIGPLKVISGEPMF